MGRPYSVIRSWSTDEARHRGWYVNLEQPWTRTPIGFDSRDNVLDVVVTEDLSSCRLKDEEELDFAVAVDKLSPADAAEIQQAAADAIDDVRQRRWPFDEAGWSRFQPMVVADVPVLPDGWDEP